MATADGSATSPQSSSFAIAIHAEKCICAGHCVAAAEDIFAQDDDGVVLLLNQMPLIERLEAAKTAARKCPVRAIEILSD